MFFLPYLLILTLFSQNIITQINTKELNIGICIMATGKYTCFIEALIKSAEKYFLPMHNKTYFIFTDGEIQEHERIIKLPQKRLGWPYDTMMRFQVYAQYADFFKEMDCLFALDADMKFVNFVGDEVLYTKNGQLAERVAIMHPGFYNKKREHFSYETNPASTAYIGSSEGKFYFCGGFWGGTTEGFLETCHYCIEHINKDLDNGIIAVWHDESHRNRYLIDFPPSVILGPEYCHPEHQRLDYIFTPRLLALDKNHTQMREEENGK